MLLKCRHDIEHHDLPNIESPIFARSLIERELSLNSNDSLWIRGIREVLGTHIGPYTGVLDQNTLNRLWDMIESCEVFLVHDGGTLPSLPLMREGSEPDTWQADDTLSNVANHSVEHTTTKAVETKGKLNGMWHGNETQPAAAETTKKKEERPKKGGIALLPVRYAIGTRGENDGLYGYTHDKLKDELPELKHSRYVLRTLRTGYLYVHYEDELVCFKVGPNRLIPPKKGSTAGIRANGDALIFPSDKKEVMLAFSEHEWTKQQCKKITDNEDSCRDSQMQRYALDSVDKNSLPLNDLASEVEEYAGRGEEYNWSPYISAGKHTAADRTTAIKSRAGVGHVVVLHDPIAITHDLGSLIENNLEKLRLYVSKPEETSGKEAHERYRRKIIADTIGRLYESNFAKNYYSNLGGDVTAPPLCR